MWNVETGERLYTFMGTSGGWFGQPITFNNDGTKLAYLLEDGVSIRDVATGEEIIRVNAQIYLHSFNAAFAFTSDDSLIFYGSDLWNTKTGESVAQIDVGTPAYGGAPEFGFISELSPDGKLIAISHGGGVRLWGVPVGE